MTDREEDKLGMYFSVEGACGKHNGAWAALPAFVTAFGEFQSHVAGIGEKSREQETGVTGASLEKSKAKQAMVDEAFPLGTAIQAWAVLNGDEQLAKRVYHSRTTYTHARDTEAEKLARTVLTEATNNLAALADYGVTQVRVDDLEAAADAYHAVIVAPRAAITDRKAATAGLKGLFASTDLVLKMRMDKLEPILAAAQPAFAGDYANARIIVDSGGG